MRTHSDYKDPTVADLLEILRQPIDRSSVRQKQGIDYMTVTTIKDALDWLLGPHRWRWRVVHSESLLAAPYYVVRGELTLVGSDGEHTQTGQGAEPLWPHLPNDKGKTKAYGDPSTNAEASALRRAAEAHGFARELWRK